MTPFGPFAARRQIRETALGLGQVAVLEGEQRQALIDLGSGGSRCAQPLELLASLLAPIKLQSESPASSKA